MPIIYKQFNFTHWWDPNRYTAIAHRGPESNSDEEVTPLSLEPEAHHRML